MASSRPNILTQLQEIWSRLQGAQRFTIAFFAVVVLAALVSLTYYMNQVDYQVLYRDLSPEDAQAIAAKLKEEKRDFLASPDGSLIQVAGSKEEVDKLRLEIAGSGLARSGKVGFEIFDKNQFGMTDFTEQVNYRRALEGELSRTVSSLSEVQMARVHLVLPKNSLFEEQKEEAKASVVVRLRKGSELSKSNINGIVNLVAAAVEGLKPHNVSVVDWQGNLLSRPIPAGEGARAEFESNIRTQLEREMVLKVISILEPLVGKGKVHANSSINLDFNSSEQTEETYNPSGPVLLSQQKSEERMGRSPAASGVPGTASNLGTVAGGSATSPERVRQSEVSNYEVSKTVRHTVQPKGSINKVSLAVILDHKAVYAKGDDGKVTVKPEARTQQELDSYRELVQAAIGFDKARGDIVTLENVAFYSENIPEEDQPPLPWYVKWQHLLFPAMKYGAFLLLFLMVYLILFRPMRKKVYQSFEKAASTAQNRVAQIAQNVDASALHPGPQPAVSEGRTNFLPEGNPLSGSMDAGAAGEMTDEQIEREFMKEMETASAGARRHDVLRKRFVEKAKREPEQISQVIRAWMQE